MYEHYGYGICELFLHPFSQSYARYSYIHYVSAITLFMYSDSSTPQLFPSVTLTQGVGPCPHKIELSTL